MSLRFAKNGRACDVVWKGKKILHNWDQGDINMDYLGPQLNKDKWINDNIKDISMIDSVKEMLIDWKLYENGWYVYKYDNKNLYYYLTQIGYSGFYRPEALKYLI